MNRLNEIQEINSWRYERWMAGTPGWTILEAAGELCGEAGELANVCKKLRRLELGIKGNGSTGLQEKLEGEVGDVLITLCIVATKAGVNVDKAVTHSFNKKSEEMGFPERI